MTSTTAENIRFMIRLLWLTGVELSVLSIEGTSYAAWRPHCSTLTGFLVWSNLPCGKCRRVHGAHLLLVRRAGGISGCAGPPVVPADCRLT